MQDNLNLFLGKTKNNQEVITDFSKNPHMLIAGCTGSGKTVLLHTIIKNLKQKPNTYLFLTDTKIIEFNKYENDNNIDVAYDYEKALLFLEYIIEQMDFRYYILSKNPSWNFSNIFFIVDEFADLIMQDEKKIFYNSLCKLTQKSRAAKIYVIMATQRPSSDIISGRIKANFPARISCKVASKLDSRVILDKTGAELLAGNGDAVINNYNNNYTRFQVKYE